MAALRSHTPKADPRLARRGAAAMRYATICSGIEAVSVALSGLDAEPVFFADIEPFPKALLAHHYPDVPELGDMTQWREPDGYTRIPYRGKPASQCPDGPRYRALGNSMAVPVMRWILQRVMA